MSTRVPVREAGLEEVLADREPGLVGLRAALGGELLEELVSGLPSRFRGDARVVHLRVKPGTSVQAAVEVAGPAGTRPWLLACYAPGDAAKAARDAAYAHRHQLPSVWRPMSRIVLVPAAGDRALRPHGRRLGTPGVRTRPVPGLPRGETTPLRHNPARRLVAVLESHGERWVLKAHASCGHGDHARRLAGAVPAWAVAPLAGTSRDGRLVAHRWVRGRPARPGSDDAAVVAVLRALHGSPPPEGLPRLDDERLRAAAVAGVAGLAVFDPEVADFARGLLPSLRRALEATPVVGGRAAPVLLHGDLSADQVVVHHATAVLLDLDRACVGPAGWDAATWLAGQVAAGVRDDPLPLPVEPPEPGLVAAASLARAPEPWRRRLPDRGAAAAGLVALAARDLGMEP
ncbi:MAG TPA: hypothetical protein VFR74_12075 [Jiangellales bacterium]|nr:hypothetical protein [Jiangellales bacterium]